MKTIVLSFILIFQMFIHLLYAQVAKHPRNMSDMNIVDSGNIRIWYALNALDITNHKTYDDCQRLEIGTYLSRYYSYFIYNSDSLTTAWATKHPVRKRQGDAIENQKWIWGMSGKDERWSEYYWSDYFKDFSKNVLSEYAWMPLYIPNYQYSENLPIQDWIIYLDTLTIVGYLCQKASCKFRGRNYTAWFAPDIPINNGPWKFGGLPGLILKVYDDNKLYTFECIGIENNKTKYMIKMFPAKYYQQTKRKKLLTLQKELHENYRKIIGNEQHSTKKIYHPIELE